MNSTLRSRDGHPSIAAAILVGDAARAAVVEATMQEVLRWAADNRLRKQHDEDFPNTLARVNAERRKHDLPPFYVAAMQINQVEEFEPERIRGATSSGQLRSKAAPLRLAGGSVRVVTIQKEADEPMAEPVVPSATESQDEAEPDAASPEEPAPLVAVQPELDAGVEPGSADQGRQASKPAAAPGSVAEPSPICDSQDELLTLVTEFQGTKTGIVTPEIAGWLLALNTGNRPLQKTQVQRFRDILKGGLWVNTGEPVIVSREGVLNDGQHRLNALMLAGLPALMDIRFGIERAAFAATGTGTRRTAGQALAISGVKNAASQAAIARLLVHYDAGEMARASQQVENDVLIRTLEGEPRIAEVAEMIQRHRFAPTRTAPFGLVLVVASRGGPINRVSHFAGIVNTALGVAETDPAYQLHIRLRDAATRKMRISQIDMAALTARAWNAWAEGRTLSRLVLQDSDRTSAGFPKVVSA